MRKIAVIPILLMLATSAFAQNLVKFEITLADSAVSNSLYNSINVIDTRADRYSFGYVQTGAFNRIGKVVIEHDLNLSVKQILTSLLGPNSSSGELLLQLRQFDFAEVTGTLGEFGYCTIKADMYSRGGTGYKKINSLDTIIRLRSSLDVSNAILRSGSRQLTSFIKGSLFKKPISDGRLYSNDDIMHIDSIEKRDIVLYNTISYTNGLYLTYQSFKNQVPDKQGLTVENDYVYPGYVKSPDEKGKFKDVKLKKTYAIVYKGTPYIVTEFGFYPLRKVNNDFTFTGMAKTPPSAASLMMVSAMFGTVGALAASSGNEGTFEMRIDHQNGGIVKIREVATPTTVSKGDSWD